MVPFFVVGGVLITAAAVVVTLRRRYVAAGMVPPEGIVYMEESVLNEFLTKEHDRTRPRPQSASKLKPTGDRTDQDASTGEAGTDADDAEVVTDASADDHAADVEPPPGADGMAERFVASEHGGGTVVAGPPVDLADEGWAPDPVGDHEWRYFDADGWSQFVLDGETVGTDPLAGDKDANEPTAISQTDDADEPVLHDTEASAEHDGSEEDSSDADADATEDALSIAP